MLLLGSGGREHAIAWRVSQSPRLDKLWTAPGNAGTSTLGENISEIVTEDANAVTSLAAKINADLVIVGPENPLAEGVSDFLVDAGIPVFGPSRLAAEIESSKTFAKELMASASIGTARARTFENADEAKRYIQTLDSAPVVKADGLAAGKGVIICESLEEAEMAIERSLENRIFGDAGARVLIEERLSGPETSAHVITDGTTVRHMPFSCDYKLALDGDRGPNTGGMGVYSPPGWLDQQTASIIESDVSERTISALAAIDRPYRGVLYPGIMVTPDGPKVLEFNCRFGDPEAEALLPRLQSDLLEICEAAAVGKLGEVPVEWSGQATVGVVMTSDGYPNEYEVGFPIDGINDVDNDVNVFLAGVDHDTDGRLITAGGRVLCVVASGDTIAEARERVYDNVSRIRFRGAHYRRDIAAREVEPLKAS